MDKKKQSIKSIGSITSYYCNLQFLNNVIMIKTKVFLPRA